ncbi:MAG: GDSL family lipase, partial [Oscillospiraceae bacterium]|nr:GDSL family lipase [Oscillospiraceae bacterium]
MLTSCGSDDSSASSSKTDGGSSVTDSIVQDSSEEEKDLGNTVALTAENVKLVGRTWLSDDTLWLALSGAGVEFEYTGKKLDITIAGDSVATTGTADNQARVAIYVDGERVIDEMIDSAEETFTAFESAEAKTVNVKIIKLSECAMSTCGIKAITVAEGETIKPAAKKTHTIEFIGDSITCGYGVDDEVKENHFSTKTEDVTKAYAYKTAQALDADYSMFSISGYGIISGYTTGDEPVSAQTIPQYYESLGFSYGAFASTT